MPEYKTRQDLGYSDTPSEKKCRICKNYDHAQSVCEIMNPDDARVQGDGGCTKGFEAGKALLHDYDFQRRRFWMLHRK